jgi:hypothetical protein
VWYIQGLITEASKARFDHMSVAYFAIVVIQVTHTHPDKEMEEEVVSLEGVLD